MYYDPSGHEMQQYNETGNQVDDTLAGEVSNEGGSNYKGQAYEGIRNPEMDFVNGKGNNTLAKHADKHGYDSPEEYLKDATNGFGKINQYGGISTYFKSDEGMAYWLEQIKKYAPK